MSIIAQLKKKNKGKLPTLEDLGEFTFSRKKDPETIKKIKLNRKLMREGKVVVRKFRIGK